MTLKDTGVRTTDNATWKPEPSSDKPDMPHFDTQMPQCN